MYIRIKKKERNSQEKKNRLGTIITNECIENTICINLEENKISEKDIGITNMIINNHISL